MRNLRAILVLAFCLPACFINVYGQQQEAITITTFYPSPYGVYRELRLFPQSNPSVCNREQEGLMYYNEDDRRVLVCSTTDGFTYAWTPVGGLWKLSEGRLYPNNPDWNVGIGAEITRNARLSVTSSRGIGGIYSWFDGDRWAHPYRPTIGSTNPPSEYGVAATSLNRGIAVLGVTTLDGYGVVGAGGWDGSRGGIGVYGETSTSFSGSTAGYAGYFLGGSGVKIVQRNHENQNYNGTLLTVLGNVGIGTTGPRSRLSVGGDGQYSTGIYGQSSLFGVYGVATSLNLFEPSYGVYGVSRNTGVYGRGDHYGVHASSGNYGVYGVGGQRGVVGFSSSGFGILGSSDFGYAGWFQGAVRVTGEIETTSKSFVQPHPTDPGKEVNYTAFEGRDHRVFFDGVAQLKDGQAVIEVPEDFRIVASRENPLNVVITPFGAGSLYVKERSLNEIVVASQNESDNFEFGYLVIATRGGFEESHPIQANRFFRPNETQTLEEFERHYSLEGIDELSPYAKAGRVHYRDLLISSGILTNDGKANIELIETMGWEYREEESGSIEAIE